MLGWVYSLVIIMFDPHEQFDKEPKAIICP